MSSPRNAPVDGRQSSPAVRPPPPAVRPDSEYVSGEIERKRLHSERSAVTPAPPEPTFEITGAAHVPFAAAPTLLFSGRAIDDSGLEIQSIALTAQVMIDPAQRGYDDATRMRLQELFGPPATWAPSTSGLSWARVATAVPSFSGVTAFAIEVPCTYDLEVAAAKYFYAVRDGHVPLSFHFNGSVFYRTPRRTPDSPPGGTPDSPPGGTPDSPPGGTPDGTPGGILQVTPVSWSSSARYRMPVETWRAMIAEHYPGGGWIRLSELTLGALNDRRSARGLPSFDAAVSELLTDPGGEDHGFHA
jgi:hypothetical protein